MRRGSADLILHVGQHKTGSKSLQSFLAHNRHPLLAQGLLYPLANAPDVHIRAYALSQFSLFALIRREAIDACQGRDAADHYWERVSRFCQPFETAGSVFETIEEIRRQKRQAQVVLSAEDFFDMHTAHELDFSRPLVAWAAHRLAELASCFGWEPRVIVYLRRQDHLLGAHYVQFIKGSHVHDISFEEFARAFAARLDSRSLLADWASAFGEDRIVVRPYEREALPGGIISDFLEHALGWPIPATCVEPPPDAESVNRTPDRDFVEYIRILNRRNALGLSTFPRDAVLEVALRAADGAKRRPGIASWLSPASRRQLLAAFSEGNSAIARDFLQRDDGRMFDEPPPDESEDWSPYPGLDPEKAAAISLEIHENILARRTGLKSRLAFWAGVPCL
jgi:hypothetical protein